MCLLNMFVKKNLLKIPSGAVPKTLEPPGCFWSTLERVKVVKHKKTCLIRDDSVFSRGPEGSMEPWLEVWNPLCSTAGADKLGGYCPSSTPLPLAGVLYHLLGSAEKSPKREKH